MRIIGVFLSLPFMCFCIFDVPGMTPSESYYIDGDFNVGIIMSIRLNSEDSGKEIKCGLINPWAIQRMEIFADTVRDVNKEGNLFPNVKMGITILDDCDVNRYSAARAMQFMPPTEGICQYNYNASVDAFPSFQVNAVITSSNSKRTALIANSLNTFEIPVLATKATSEELNDEYEFPYFSRTIPSDLYQARTLVDLMTKFDWSYVTLIYSMGDYGDSGSEAMIKLAEESGICISYSVSIHLSYSEKFFEDVANKVVSEMKSNVVVLFIHSSQSHMMLTKLNEANTIGRKFIFLCTDGVNYDFFDRFPNLAIGSYFIDLYGGYIDTNFYETWDAIGPYTFRNSETSYFRDTFEERYDCSTRNESDKEVCSGSLRLADIISYRSDWSTIYRDPLSKTIEAMQLYFQHNCPEIFDGGYTKQYIQECMQKEQLFNYIEKVITVSSRRYRVRQLQVIPNKEIPRPVYVGTWEMSLMDLKLNDSILKWASNKTYPPESICAYPCKIRQFKIQLELKCCWECRYCHKNEIVVKNNSNCESCPEFYWPDQETATYCYAIAYTHYTWDSTATIGIAVIVGLCVIICIFTLIYFLINRQTKLIKATGLSLSLITLLGVFMSFPSALLMVAPPNPHICATSSVGMHLGFCITYSSLLTKTNRIFRVFQAAKHSAKMPKYIRNSAILLFTSILVMIQIFILTVTMFMSPLKTSLRQPVATEEFVELMCDLPLKTFIPPLGFNMILIIFCSIYAIKTRKLPDNFNESKLIFLLVLATCFLWMAFLPTYFAAQDSQQKAGLLAMLLLISGILTIICLFFPKIYATIYVDENDLNTNKIGFSATSNSGSS